MPTPKKKLLQAWEESGKLEQFKEDYPLLDKDTLLEKYGMDMNSREDRKWDSLIEVANSLGLKRVNKGVDFDVDEHKVGAQVIEDKKIVVAQSEAKYYKSLYSKSVKSASINEVIEQAIRDSVTPIQPVTPKKLKVVDVDRGNHTAVAMLTDPHIGEVVSEEQTGGLGRYDMDIFSRRLGMWSAKVLELVELKRKGVNIPKLKVLCLGDFVTGEIHEELVRTNADNIVGAVSRGAYMLAQALTSLAEHFETLDVHCVVGNHGRMRKKPYAKEKYVNWDYILYQMMAMFMSRQPNVTFDIPKSFYQLVPVENMNLLMLHGDGIRGSMGIPWYGIERATLRLKAMLEERGQSFDKVVMGHFHDPVSTERFIVGGTMKGCDEFSITALHVAGVPSQTMFYVHPRHGVISTETIYLAGADEKPEYQIPDGLSSVWAESLIK